MTLYGSTKAAASLMVQERGRSLGIETLVLRLFNLWGACEPPHRLFPSLLRASRDRRPLALTPGTQLKDYSFVDDVANWILRLATMPGIGSHCPVINLGSGRPEPLRDFATDLARPLGAVDLLHFGARPSRAGEPIMQVPDLARLENLLPDRRITGRAEALERVLAMEDAAA
jgi:nucleoside-diphosphate-sugar epimerase